jgi:hypothetical protein
VREGLGCQRESPVANPAQPQDPAAQAARLTIAVRIAEASVKRRDEARLSREGKPRVRAQEVAKKAGAAARAADDEDWVWDHFPSVWPIWPRMAGLCRLCHREGRERPEHGLSGFGRFPIPPKRLRGRGLGSRTGCNLRKEPLFRSSLPAAPSPTIRRYMRGFEAKYTDAQREAVIHAMVTRAGAPQRRYVWQPPVNYLLQRQFEPPGLLTAGRSGARRPCVSGAAALLELSGGVLSPA